MDQPRRFDHPSPTHERLLAYARARSGPLLPERPGPLPTLGELATELGIDRVLCLQTLTALSQRGLLEVRIDVAGRLDVRLGATTRS